jgi:hypothetical protein
LSLSVLEIGHVETLGEPAVYRSEQVARLGTHSLLTPMSGEAGGSTKFEHPRMLASRKIERSMKILLRRRHIATELER